MPQNVLLPGPPPWGFRLSGGIDFNQPLIITRVRPFRSRLFAFPVEKGLRVGCLRIYAENNLFGLGLLQVLCFKERSNYQQLISKFKKSKREGTWRSPV